MTTTVSEAAKSSTSRKASEGEQATNLLRADHKLVKGYFDEYEKTRSLTTKESLVAKICAELSVHAQVEEEIFYPAFKKAMKDKTLVPEAVVEHATLMDLISQVEGVKPDGEMFDAKIKVLAEYVAHHVKEEQKEMFPQAESSSLDMVELGAAIQLRKSELMAERAAREPGKPSGRRSGKPA